MTDDLVKRLREYAIHMDAWGKEANHDADIVDEAADCIEKLEAALREITWIATPDHEEARNKATEIARKALEGKDV
jgi:hypothetical protein